MPTSPRSRWSTAWCSRWVNPETASSASSTSSRYAHTPERPPREGAALDHTVTLARALGALVGLGDIVEAFQFGGLSDPLTILRSPRSACAAVATASGPYPEGAARPARGSASGGERRRLRPGSVRRRARARPPGRPVGRWRASPRPGR
ncbi:hypothetical protein FF096_06085 [Micromonospora sp. CP22]|nr:hypothetical protein [Micromonospora sp. CP22]